jgi:small subunit ribosomal protein S2
MSEFIFGARGGVHIIDLEKTLIRLEDATEYVKNLVARGGTILFLGTKNQACDIIEKHALDCGMPYVNTRWLGGTLTNNREVMNLVRRYHEIVEMRDNGEMAKRYTKKEQSRFARQIKDAERKIGGIKELNRLPDAIYIVDLVHEKTALLEANVKRVPVVALTDTNVNPGDVAYPIPSNDDAVKTIELMTSVIAAAVKEGTKLHETQAAESAKAALVAKPVAAPVEKAPPTPEVQAPSPKPTVESEEKAPPAEAAA